MQKYFRHRNLRVIAVSAPEYPEGALGQTCLTSQDPASLYNATRFAAFSAEAGRGAWGESNWSGPRGARREQVALFHSLKENVQHFREMLHREQPNMVLIGAMTMCFPGAIELAKVVKEELGPTACVVLGGRHVSETMYETPKGIVHHPGSPVLLMCEGIIDPVFDIVIAGEGEHIIARLGEMIASIDRQLPLITTLHRRLDELREVSGKWIVGVLDSGAMRTITGQGPPLDRNVLPSPVSMFGIRSSFDVFGGRLTGHVFSDSSSGCVYDCNFCSERRSVTGPLLQFNSSANRLFKQLQDTARVIKEDTPGYGASAFVEDSTLLAGSAVAMKALIQNLSKGNIDVQFGAQLTIDQVLSQKVILRELRLVGLRYLFVGLETVDPSSIGGMSKDVKVKKEKWVVRAEKMLEALAELDITCGVAVLFGLGETHKHRLELLDHVSKWRNCYGFPNPISMNWAVQHPLQGDDGGTQYRYHEWGVPTGEYLEAFQDFGEASIRYPLAGQAPPVLEEVEEIRAAYTNMRT